ncbi:hypothetical protein E2P81_ATG02749 [Venturia nashicola]|nr:hypothetical protein E2P81_ATG02749 [Venturia nashicola]
MLTHSSLILPRGTECRTGIYDYIVQLPGTTREFMRSNRESSSVVIARDAAYRPERHGPENDQPNSRPARVENVTCNDIGIAIAILRETDVERSKSTLTTVPSNISTKLALILA